MTSDTTPRCALGVSDRTLSDYRSNGLSAKEMGRIQAHIAQCLTCQARLSAYEAVAGALRAHSELKGHAQLWQNVRASIAATPASSVVERRSRRAHGSRSRSLQAWAAFGSIAAVVALAIGFVALFASHGGRTPATPQQATPITIRSGSLTWKQAIVPKGFPSVDQANDSATHWGALIAPGDGNTAYACQANRHKVAAPVAWATHDAGAHWSVITPTDLPANTGGCRLTVDANDAGAVIASFFPTLRPDQPALPNTWVTYASFDGGATWTKPAGLNDGSVVYALASARGQVYATRTTYTADGQSHTAFSVSRDQMQTWTQMDANLPETQPNPSSVHDTGKVFQIWVNPATGEALELTYADSLWSTRDDGAHWSRITFPAGVYVGDSHAPGLVIGAPAVSGHLTICGAFTPIGSDSESFLECSANDGATWVRRPDLSMNGTGGTNLSVAGMSADGSIYAVQIAPANRGNGNETLYRLSPQATSTADWQRLGEIPESQYGSGFQIAPAGDYTAIWLFPGITTTGDSSGSKTHTQPYYYVAMYP